MKKSAYVTFLSLFFVLNTYSAAAKAPAATPTLLEKGKAVFAVNCLTCHGENGDGMGPAGQYLNPKPRNFAKDKFKKGDKADQIFQTITKGLDGTAMVSFAHLSEEDRWALAHYVRKLGKKK